MSIVAAVEPEGWKEWSEKANRAIAEHPEVFNTPEGDVAHEGGKHLKEIKAGKSFVTTKAEPLYDDTVVEWDGEKYSGGELEGIRSLKERKGQDTIGAERPGSDTKTVAWDPEPALTIEQ
jgi:NADH dehydrogenase (ubiquinone) 1 alpha subcomplex subunit 5